MSATAAPRHRLFADGPTKGIAIGDWQIATTKRPICNSAELDRVAEWISIPLPEMLFGNNELVVAHRSGVSVVFNAVEALALVDDTPESADKTKVAASAQWTRTSVKTHGSIHKVVRPYDWTYTTEYCGTVSQRGGSPEGESQDRAVAIQMQPSEVGINIQRLIAPEPILFYDELVLFEDELADNGAAVLSLRMRVMPSCFLVLQRFFLRVDNVLLRINDTRVFHEFGSDVLIREYTSREAPYESVKQSAAAAQDLSAMTDANWVSARLEQMGPPVVHRRESVVVGSSKS
ncbi:Tap42 interacting protein [Polyrhizophydium stewartii]|uniref:Tap42 interacting protein n=1 Tax=Polyrhizophydium stewartii TaxID=2732419 RepID=A0ABR4NE80_9FUNG